MADDRGFPRMHQRQLEVRAKMHRSVEDEEMLTRPRTEAWRIPYSFWQKVVAATCSVDPVVAAIQTVAALTS